MTDLNDFKAARARHQASYRRRDLLLALLASTNHSCNESLLRMILRGAGYPLTDTLLREDVAWLAERDLVASDTLGDLQIVKLLARGGALAQGDEVIEGVAGIDFSRS